MSEPASTPPRARQVVALLAAALVPLAAGIAAAVALRTRYAAPGQVGGQRLVLSALGGDWALALGMVLSVVALLPVVVHLRWRSRAARAAREQAAADARAAEEDRRLLLSRLDHELKNPLTAMRAALANVRAAVGGETLGAVLPEGVSRGLASIDDQALRLSRLTADLRKIADVRAAVVERQSVDLAELLGEVVEVVADQPVADGRSISVDLPQAPRPLPPVLGDGDLLGLALVNLVENAVKYTPAGGAVEVRAREEGAVVLIEVADTGPGIAAEDLPHVFEELYRSPRTMAVPGSGLGLPLVRAVVEAHGGTVVADSPPGRGLAVHVRLPVAG